MSRLKLVALLLASGAVLVPEAQAGSPLEDGPSPEWGYGYEVPTHAYAYGYYGYRHGQPVYSVFGYVAPEDMIETSPFMYFEPKVRIVRVGKYGRPKTFVPDLFVRRPP